jgi:hypothetical protein
VFAAVRRYSGLLYGRIGEDRLAAATSRESPDRSLQSRAFSILLRRRTCAFAVKPTTTAGNCRRRWCIQPIGCTAKALRSQELGGRGYVERVLDGQRPRRKSSEGGDTGARQPSMKRLARKCSAWHRSLLRSHPARFRRWRERLVETRAHGPAALQEGLAVASFPASVRRPSGSRAARKAGAFGASAPCVLCRSDSRGARTPSSRLRVERIRTPSAVTLEGFCSEGPFVPAGNYTELDTRRR